jgi:hypothetical protein
MEEEADKILASRIRIMNDIVERAINSSNVAHNVRMDSIEHGIKSFQADLVRVPTTVDRAITALRELLESRLERNASISTERFLRIDSQLIERDKRSDQLSLSSSTAIATAMLVQKEAAAEVQKSSAVAIAKAEVATSDSIKQLQTLFQTSIAALNTQVQDIKSRLDKGEGIGTGRIVAVQDHRYERKDQREEERESKSMIFGVVGTAIGLAALVVTIFVSVVPHLSH